MGLLLAGDLRKGTRRWKRLERWLRGGFLAPSAAPFFGSLFRLPSSAPFFAPSLLLLRSFWRGFLLEEGAFGVNFFLILLWT